MRRRRRRRRIEELTEDIKYLDANTVSDVEI